MTAPVILLIDDEAGIRLPLRPGLERCGYRVLEAADGEKGLELTAQSGNEIALVVVDHRMPCKSGAEIVRELCRRSNRMPTIMMSGRRAPPDRAGSPRYRVVATA